MMEEPEIRQLVDEAELEVLKDSTKKDMLDLKEELFFTIDEKQHDSDLTEKGRKFLNPTDPDAFVIPDLVTALQEVDARGHTSRREGQEEAHISRVLTNAVSGFTTSHSSCAPMPVREGRGIRCPGKQGDDR